MSRFALIVSVLSLCLALGSCKVVNLEINAETKLCSSAENVQKDTEIAVISKGDLPQSECSLTFNADGKSGECGICFQFENYAYFNTTDVSLVLTAGSMSMVIDTTDKFPSVYMCSDEPSVSLTLTHQPGYKYDPEYPGYRFILDVFNKCGYRGTAKSVPFDEVVEHATGYTHGKERLEDKEMSTFLTGLAVGLCLASVFLVVLLAGWCYVKNKEGGNGAKSRGNK